MENQQIAKVFKLYSQLMELHNENPFRTKAIASAAFRIDKLPFKAENADLQTLSAEQGIGSSTAERIQVIIRSGTLPELDQLLEKTPAGVREMLRIKGLGPKKIRTIWKDLEIESIGELLYACNENRLIEAKGFGEKTQEDIKNAIEFSIDSEGWVLYAKAEIFANVFLANLQSAFSDHVVEFTGDFRRKCEVLKNVDILTTIPRSELVQELGNQTYVLHTDVDTDYIEVKDENNYLFHIYVSNASDFAKDWILTTGADAHLKLLETISQVLPEGRAEEEIYQKLNLQWIAPELREGLDEVSLAKSHQLPLLIRYEDLKGSLHNHSTYSDGVHSLREMALYCKDHLGLEYLGICDHSKTASYAGGLSIAHVQEQWAEIDKLNEELKPFKIFKGIESDILGDGSLDYPDDILAGFDFVVASVHSALKMDEQRATERLIKAIENPYTTILGHPTSRLLLSRAGYPIDFKKVIDACATNQVVIEINANPLRLDLDWRWHRYALEKGVLLSINPDAHRTEGFLDMHYGIYVGRKGGLTKDRCLNAFSLNKIEAFFEDQHAKRK